MEKKEITCAVSIYQIEELSAEEQNLVNKAKEATKSAYAPYSKFYVGASVLLENGTIVTGNNQENGAYPSGLCAERVALFYANAQYPNLAVKAIAVAVETNGEEIKQLVAPCGACRQVILESEMRYKQPIRILMSSQSSINVVESIKDLLPLYFELKN